MFNRRILMDAIEKFNLPENIVLVEKDNWPVFAIREKSVVAKFLFNDFEFKIEFFVWSQFQEINRGFIPTELKKACFGIFEIFRDLKTKELLLIDQAKKSEKSEKKLRKADKVVITENIEDKIDRAFQEFQTWLAA